MSILIGADLVPTENNIAVFNYGNISELFDEQILNWCNCADFRIFNLEVPITDQERPIKKCGPNLIAPRSTMKGIKNINPSLLAIANNHIFDQGETGLFDTIEILDSYKIPHIGAGKNIEEAAKPFYFEFQNKVVCVFACSEHEFSITSPDMPGANPFEPLETPDIIHDIKEKCDYLIVLYHGGKEHYRFPSPYLQKVFRKFAEKGADLVIAQHTHCVGCEEKYKGSTLVYGQGNFLFQLGSNEFWDTGLLVEVKDDFSINYLPIKKSEKGIMSGDETIIDGFYERSKLIEDPEFLEKQYCEYAQKMSDFYRRKFVTLPKNFIFRCINKLTAHRLEDHLLNKRLGLEKKLAIRNIIECEAHRELLLKGLYD